MPSDPAEWNLRAFRININMTFPLGINEPEFLKAARAGKQLPVAGSMFDGLNEAQLSLLQYVGQTVREAYDPRSSLEKPEVLSPASSATRSLSAIDRLWQGSIFTAWTPPEFHRFSRAYAQRDPLIEYKAGGVQALRRVDGQHQDRDLPQISSGAPPSLMAFGAVFPQSAPDHHPSQQASAFGADPGRRRSPIRPSRMWPARPTSSGQGKAGAVGSEG